MSFNTAPRHVKPEGDDETSLSSEPSGLPSPEAFDAQNQNVHSKFQRPSTNVFHPDCKPSAYPAEFLLSREFLAETRLTRQS